MKESEYEKKWKEKGFSFAIGSIKLDKGVDEAVHDDLDEVVVAVNGELQFIIDDKIIIAECDTEVLIPAKSIHSIKNVGGEVSKIYYGYKSVAL